MTQKQRKPAGKLATTIAIIAILAFIVVSFAALPLVALLIGMAVGYVLELFTGDYVVHAFNAIGFSGVKSGDLPKVFGLLAVVASMLKIGASNVTKKIKTDE